MWSSRPVVIGALGLLAVACSAKESPPADLGPCLADSYEPNDSAATAAALGSIQDDDTPFRGTDASPPPKLIRKEVTTHADGDVDWFTVDVDDSGFSGNPGISVIVSSAYEATAWWSCTNGTTESVVCGLGTSVTDDPEFAGRGCITKPGTGTSTSINVNLTIECAGTSTDSGKLTVRVRRLTPTTTCERYTLTVGAD